MWCALEEVYRGCVDFNRQGRLSLDKAVDIMRREENGYEVIPLKVSQSTAVQQFDQNFAARLEESGCEEPVQPESVPSNDGTNACAFLAVKIVDRILTEIGTDGEVFADIADAAEETIWLLPEKINEYRDISKMYDPLPTTSRKNCPFQMVCFLLREDKSYIPSSVNLDVATLLLSSQVSPGY